MKYILVVALVLVAFWFWRNGRRQERAEAARKPAAAPTRAVAAPLAMTRCAVCGLHLPEADALVGPGGWYCGPEHRSQAGR
ncbi:MAG: hypothetical protein EOP39_21290 [Rubrivivax sp.]|nr:MAG: hypothetical protein EOP39_21290 [Rubrivivax sp.]